MCNISAISLNRTIYRKNTKIRKISTTIFLICIFFVLLQHETRYHKHQNHFCIPAVCIVRM